jgi:hypothetical protein
MRITNTGQIGIGTVNPLERLDVRGNIKLGNNGDLFALGSLVNLRLVAGRVNTNGSIASGSEFTVVRNSVGRYTVSFTPVFTGTPIVVASAFELSNNDNLVAVENINSLNFQLFAKDTTPPGGDEGQLQDTAFTFIAVGSP